MALELSLKGYAETVVDSTNTALVAGSGTLDVFATPMMIALMERAAWISIAPHLPEGDSTVGTKMDVSHQSATPIGMRVWAESQITELDGKRIELTVSAFDEKGLIGTGTHQRFIVTNDRFLAKAARKQEN